jgi:hypothetical protein
MNKYGNGLIGKQPSDDSVKGSTPFITEIFLMTV